MSSPPEVPGHQLPNSRSAQIYARAREVLPGGTARTSTHASPHPIYLSSGHGARVTDVDGLERIDFSNNFTTMIHGYSNPVIEAAVIEQLRLGTSFSFATEKEVELAELLCARVSSMEQVRFMNSGTEAVMHAMRAARALTGRPKIAKCEGAFHGSYDYAEVSLGSSPEKWGKNQPATVPYSQGTPQAVLEDVVVIPFNDTEAAAAILDAAKHELAGVLIDPIANRAGMISATTEFLTMLRAFCNENDVVLISDEVLCFRLGFHGAQAEFGYDADLTVLGKIIGGGFPVGAVGGPVRFMKVFDPTDGKPAMDQSGTFSGNPITMAAGKAGMELLTPEVFDRLNGLGELARTRLREVIAESEIAGQVTGCGSLFRIHLTARTLLGYRDAYPSPEERARLSNVYEYLLDHDILISPTGMCALTTPMDESDIDALCGAVRAGLAQLN